MATRERQFISNNTYFITFSILDWKNIFISDKYCDLVYKWFDYMKKEYGNKVYGYVIMPTHIHCILHISEKSKEISKLIQNAKRFLAYQIIALLEKEASKSAGSDRLDSDGASARNLLEFFASYANIKTGAKHKVFEDRFDAKIISTSKFFIEKLNYIHNNPCAKKWNLAASPQDYKYSSASNYILGKSGRYDVEIVELY